MTDERIAKIEWAEAQTPYAWLARPALEVIRELQAELRERDSQDELWRLVKVWLTRADEEYQRAEAAEARERVLREQQAHDHQALRSIRYHADNGHQDRPVDVRLRMISERANARLDAALAQQPADQPDPLHDLVYGGQDRSGFADALYKKLVKAEAKYGYGHAWLRDGWNDNLIQHMHEHIAKGDPRDVAAYCAFAWWHGWSVSETSLDTDQQPAREVERETFYMIRTNGMWWRPCGAGYTSNVDGAGLYPLQEALDRTRGLVWEKHIEIIREDAARGDQ